MVSNELFNCEFILDSQLFFSNQECPIIHFKINAHNNVRYLIKVFDKKDSKVIKNLMVKFDKQDNFVVVKKKEEQLLKIKGKQL
eukprot:403370713